MIYELKTDFRYKIRIAMVIFWDDNDIEVNLNITPDFDGYNRNIVDDCVVMDFYHLLDSLSQNVTCYLLTCECGMADDVGITAPITTNIQDDNIIWNIPIQHYRDILSEPYSALNDDILSLIFDKTQYTQTVFQLIRELKTLVKQGISTKHLKIEDFTRSYHAAEWFLPELTEKHSDLTHLPIAEINPYDGRILDFIAEY